MVFVLTPFHQFCSINVYWSSLLVSKAGDPGAKRRASVRIVKNVDIQFSAHDAFLEKP